MSFSQGLSGLNASSQALDVVGNNIANAQTVGFKAGTITFADVYAGSQTGMGVQVSGVTQNFNDGVLSEGNSELDMGIKGKGFFRLENMAGHVFYSRNGQFKTDENGLIINHQGMYLTGYQSSGIPPTITHGSAISRIKIPSDPMPGRASDAIRLGGNLDSRAEVIDSQKYPFSFDTTSHSFSSTSQINAYDSLGNLHVVNVYYVKTAPGIWQVYARDSTAPLAEGAPMPSTASGVASTPKQDASQATGARAGFARLIFDHSGQLTNNSAKEIMVEGASYKGAQPLKFRLDLTEMKQQALDTSIESATTSGHAPGLMNGYSVDDNGAVIATYSNGQQQTVGQITLSHFTNPGGLSSQGNNCWSETPSSGRPVNGLSGTGNLGKLYGHRLEASNVDMSAEMVRMIVFQRNYQSNSQTIRAQSELLQTLVNIG